MKFLILLALISLSSQFYLEKEIDFPIRGVSILRGETKDPITNQTYRISGIVHFIQQTSKDQVLVTVDVKGLPPHLSDKIVKRGFHIHEYGISNYSDDIAAVCGTTGGHYNPKNETHGYLTAKVRHEGDLGNLIINPDGTVNAILNDDRLALFGRYSIIGRALVLHGGEDDGGLLNTDASRAYGNSGPRIACGDIAYEKSVNVTSRTSVKINTGRDGFLQYLSIEEPSGNATNITSTNSTDIDIGFGDDDLNEVAQAFPSAIPVFKLFYKIIKDVSDTTRDSNFKLLKALDKLQTVPILDVISTLPVDISSAINGDNSGSTTISTQDNSTDSNSTLTYKR